MFGDNDNTQSDEPQTDQPQADQPPHPSTVSVTPAYPASDASVNTGDSTQPDPTPLPSVPDVSIDSNPPTAPETDDDALGALVTDESPEEAAPAPAENAAHEPELSDAPMAADSKDELMAIKQQALQQLSPLVGQLDQTPEERFKTTMMLIQASDNKELIADAYKAAGEINDEKARAQALLDIINEINYFTQQPET